VAGNWWGNSWQNGTHGPCGGATAVGKAWIVTGAVGHVQAVRGVSALLPHSRTQENVWHFHGISAQSRQSTLTAKQAEIQFKMKFVKKITNSTNRGRNQLFVQIGACSVGIFRRLETTHSAHLA
jgi:hypothetical protein